MIGRSLDSALTSSQGALLGNQREVRFLLGRGGGGGRGGPGLRRGGSSETFFYKLGRVIPFSSATGGGSQFFLARKKLLHVA